MALAEYRPMSGQINRRNILKALPAVAVLPAVAAAPALAYAETPIAALYREWERATAAVRAAEKVKDLPDEEFDRIVNIQTDLENDIVRMEPQSLRDLAMKLYMRASGGLCDLPPEQYCQGLWDNAAALIGGAA